MDGLQSGNIIGEDPLRTNITAKVNIRHCMTLNRQSQDRTSLEFLKVYIHTKYRFYTYYQYLDQTSMQRLT